MPNAYPNSVAFSYRAEVGRKLIHLSSLWMPAVIYYLDRRQAAALLAAALAVVALYEWLRRRPGGAGSLAGHLLDGILREKECGPGCRLTGATYVLVSALIVCVCFPKLIAVTSLSIMLLADSAAALIGRRYGKTKIFDKSLEGTAAFLCTSLLSVLMISHLAELHHRFLLAGFFASTIATLVELCSSFLRVDDNLTITLAAACAMWAVVGM